eukprot:830844-Rhodomonas_salina.1
MVRAELLHTHTHTITLTHTHTPAWLLGRNVTDTAGALAEALKKLLHRISPEEEDNDDEDDRN